MRFRYRVGALLFLLAVITYLDFGYVAKITGSYDRPLTLIALVLSLGALMWRKIDPTQELVPEQQP